MIVKKLGLQADAPGVTLTTMSSTDEMHGETKSNSILERQQAILRITSVVSAVSGNRSSR